MRPIENPLARISRASRLALARSIHRNNALQASAASETSSAVPIEASRRFELPSDRESRVTRLSNAAQRPPETCPNEHVTCSRSDHDWPP